MPTQEFQPPEPSTWYYIILCLLSQVCFTEIPCWVDIQTADRQLMTPDPEHTKEIQEVIKTKPNMITVHLHIIFTLSEHFYYLWALW